MHVLLVEPDYYTRYPPLGLLKLSAYHKSRGDTTELVKGVGKVCRKPNRIYVTSLFTWAWEPVWQAVRHYKRRFPNASLWLGGLYASLLPEHAARSGADRVYKGLFREAEDLMPDYSLVPEWDGSIVFSSRGCNNRCPFCAVPVLEGSLNSAKGSIRHLVYPGHTRIIFWDNNILQSPRWREIFDELEELGLRVDFNQGIDARLITDEVARRLSKLRLDSGGGVKVRLGYDLRKNGPFVKRAIERLNAVGISARKVMVYTLFNYVDDDPEDFFERVKEILSWGAVSYPMRYEPLNALRKNSYISPNWKPEEVEMVQKARRVLGFGGAFPPYEGLVKKLDKARNFYEAFSLRPVRKRKHPT
jgi:pyruvate-formate lyase-activating enzyme